MISLVMWMTLLSGSTTDSCIENQWAQIVAGTEASVLRREPFSVPRDPLGTVVSGACVRVEFRVGSDGVPIEVEVSKSSGARAIDVAAREAVKRFKFMPPKDGQQKFALVFNQSLP